MKTFLVGLLFCSQALGQLVLRPSTKYAADNILEQTNAAPILANLTAPRYVSTFADLAACGTDGPGVVETLGYAAAGDGGGGTFVRVAPATYTTSIGAVINGVGCQFVRKGYPTVARASWFGAVGDKSNDDTSALSATLATGAETIILDRGSSGSNYKITSGLSVASTTSKLTFENTAIFAYFATNQHEVALTIGSPGVTKTFTLEEAKILQATRYKWVYDTNVSRVGIRIYNPIYSKISWRTIEGFTMGLQNVVDYGSYWNQYENVGRTSGCKYGFVVTGSSGGSWNENEVHNGEYSDYVGWSGGGSENDGESRYGFWITGDYDHHDNEFFGASFESYDSRATPNEAVAVWLECGAQNTWHNIYCEALSYVLKTTGTAYDNLVDVQSLNSATAYTYPFPYYGSGTRGNMVQFDSKLKASKRTSLIFDSGRIGDLIITGTNSVTRFVSPWRYWPGSYNTNQSALDESTTTNILFVPSTSYRYGYAQAYNARGIGVMVPTARTKTITICPTYAVGDGTGTITSGSPTVTDVSRVDSFEVAMFTPSAITGIAAGTHITAVNRSLRTLTLSANATADGTVSLAGFGNRGRIVFRPLRANGCIDTNSTIRIHSTLPYVAGTSYGSGLTWPSSDASRPVTVEVSDSVQQLEIIFAAGTYAMRLVSLELWSPQEFSEPVMQNWLRPSPSYSITTPRSGSWYVGSIIRNASPAYGDPDGWITTTSGTLGTLAAVNAKLTSGSPKFSVDTTTHGITPGMWIQAGYGMSGRVIWVDGTATNICVSANATVTDTGYTNALSYIAPVFERFGGVVTNIVSAQNITAVSSSIAMATGKSAIKVNPDADYVLTSAPQIANGYEGQIITLYTDDAEANTVTFTDEGTHANSNLYVGGTGTNVVLSAHNSRQFIFTGGSWNLLTH